jgi:3-deoxy-manno-octulosonate cytidylyltransferase (CMP-KDO synthetase)
VSIIILIPARMASTRLPGKPLADIAGRPMIVRVWERAMAAALGPVVVAAGEKEIADAVHAAGGDAILTDPNHASGSDRIFEALGKSDPARKHDVVLNLQGDLPTIDPKIIRAAVGAIEEMSVDIGTLATEIVDPAERTNPNVTKAIVAWRTDRIGRALYFSRSTAPWGEGPLYHHIGIYAYRRAALERFVKLAPSPLEKREKLEQLRALENGMSIAVARVDTHPLGVDTQAELDRARAIYSAGGR